MIVILEILAWLLIIISVCGFIYNTSGHFKKFYHDVLGWHHPANNAIVKIHGPIVESYCEICGKRIIQDSHGDWF